MFACTQKKSAMGVVAATPAKSSDFDSRAKSLSIYELPSTSYVIKWAELFH